MFKAIINMFKPTKTEEPFNGVILSKSLEKVIESNTTSLFKEHVKTLIKEESDYIVYAIWGAKTNGVLTEEQKEINKTITPVIAEILSLINIDGLNTSQKFGIEFIIRGLFISKIIYMIEFVKNKICEADKLKLLNKSQIDVFLDNLYKNNSSPFPPRDENDGNESFRRW